MRTSSISIWTRASCLVLCLASWVSVQGGPTAADESSSGDSDHWAWQPLVRPPLPKVPDAAWPRNPTDRFVLARPGQQGLAPSTATDRRTLIRRLSFDLWGLPPRPQDIAAFVADDSPHAYERLVDRILASPTTANVGPAIGWTWCATAKVTVSSMIGCDPMHGGIGSG